MELTVFKIGFLREGNPLQEAADSAVTKHVSLLKKMIRKKKNVDGIATYGIKRRASQTDVCTCEEVLRLRSKQ